MKSNGRFWLVLIGAVVLVMLLIGGSGADGPPLDPRSVNPDGAKGIVESLERAGADVDIDGAVPSPDAQTALLLQDRLSPDDTEAIGDWIDEGGVLVVADLGSSFAARRRGGVLAGDQLRGQCTIEALAEVNELEVGGSLVDIGSGESCFGNFNEAFIVAESQGRGTVVTVGNPNLFTNAELDDGDAAVLALSLLLPASENNRVTFIGPSVVEFGEEGLTELVPRRVVNAILQLMAAFLLYALFRARRLGGVISEPVPVDIDGSELVLKSGLLSERAKDPTSAAEVLRNDFLARTRRSLSIPFEETQQVFAERIGAHLDLPVEDVLGTLTSPVVTDSDLVAVGQQLYELDHRMTAQTTKAT